MSYTCTCTCTCMLPSPYPNFPITVFLLIKPSYLCIASQSIDLGVVNFHQCSKGCHILCSHACNVMFLFLCTAPNVYSFPVFTAAFCNLLMEELEHFEQSELPKGRPNTMNKGGVRYIVLLIYCTFSKIRPQKIILFWLR